MRKADTAQVAFGPWANEAEADEAAAELEKQTGGKVAVVMEESDREDGSVVRGYYLLAESKLPGLYQMFVDVQRRAKENDQIMLELGL